MNGPYGRPWILIAAAIGCVGLLLLLVIGGITVLLVTRSADDAPPAATSAPADPEDTGEASVDPAESGAGFEVVEPYAELDHSPEELRAILEDNPLVTGTLPDVGECELPATPVEHTPEQLEAVLTAAGGCLDRVWATAAADRGVPWTSPTLVLYEYPEFPAGVACDTADFVPDSPRMCNLDSTLYWPIGAGTGGQVTEDADVPGAYLWDLSVQYARTMMFDSSWVVYYSALIDAVEAEDPEASADLLRRQALQMRCMAAASTTVLPTEAQVPAVVQEALIAPEGWADSQPPIAPETNAAWVETGFASDGDLAACNTWVAPAEETT